MLGEKKHLSVQKKGLGECCIKHFECLGRVEKHNLRTNLFIILLALSPSLKLNIVYWKTSNLLWADFITWGITENKLWRDLRWGGPIPRQ